MAGLFVYNKKINYQQPTGIDKKVISQINSLNDSGLDFSILELGGEEESKIVKLFKFVMARVPLGRGNPEWKWDKRYEKIDYIYFRRPDAMSKDLISLLKKIKRINPKSKIVMEIPNYPYENELGYRLINRPLIYKDRIFRTKIKGLIDRIAIQNEIQELYGIKTIHFTNGIDLSEFSVKKTYISKQNEINICAVASLEPWQGYERIIKGLSKYYKKGGTYNIQIRIAGNGSEFDYYKSLIISEGLSDHIYLLGRITGEKLSHLYDLSDLALDAFGRYKTGNYFSTSLKSREYLAKGIPIITGCSTDILANGFKYYLELPNDETAISFDLILDFYESVYRDISKQQVVKQIREYAETVCNISRMMEPIVMYYKE